MTKKVIYGAKVGVFDVRVGESISSFSGTDIFKA